VFAALVDFALAPVVFVVLFELLAVLLPGASAAVTAVEDVPNDESRLDPVFFPPKRPKLLPSVEFAQAGAAYRSHGNRSM
jgi:hypothetical protein